MNGSSVIFTVVASSRLRSEPIHTGVDERSTSSGTRARRRASGTVRKLRQWRHLHMYISQPSVERHRHPFPPNCEAAVSFFRSVLSHRSWAIITSMAFGVRGASLFLIVSAALAVRSRLNRRQRNPAGLPYPPGPKARTFSSLRYTTLLIRTPRAILSSATYLTSLRCSFTNGSRRSAKKSVRAV